MLNKHFRRGDNRSMPSLFWQGKASNKKQSKNFPYKVRPSKNGKTLITKGFYNNRIVEPSGSEFLYTGKKILIGDISTYVVIHSIIDNNNPETLAVLQELTEAYNQNANMALLSKIDNLKKQLIPLEYSFTYQKLKCIENEKDGNNFINLLKRI